MSSQKQPVSFLPLGALIQSLYVEDTNIVLGFSSQELYESHNSPFFGVTVGRVANRIKDAKINSLNGKTYLLAKNERESSIHGGIKSWATLVWDGPKPSGVKKIDGLDGSIQGESIEFKLRSPDDDQGFPGEVEASVIYTVATTQIAGKEAIVLEMEYQAELLSGPEETVVNMTNHSYFNLSGLPNIEGHVLELGTTTYLPAGPDCIPNGGPSPYTEYDVTKPFTLGPSEPAFNDCFVQNPDPATIQLDSRSEPLVRHLHAFHPDTNIHLEVLSTEPAFQLYTGDYTDVPAVQEHPARGARSGFACEPGRYVNAVNEPGWRNMTSLKKGQFYGSRIVYRAWKD